MKEKEQERQTREVDCEWTTSDGKVMKQNKEGEWWELSSHSEALKDKG